MTRTPRRLFLISALLVALAGPSVPSALALPCTQPGELFRVAELEGWTVGLGAEAVPAYRREGLRSRFCWGARSPGGSFAFLTAVDHTLAEDALSAAKLEALTSREQYDSLNPAEFEEEIVEVSLVSADGTSLGSRKAAVLSFRFQGSGFDTATPGEQETLFKAVFVPLVLRDRERRHHNFLYVANFRGRSAEDLKDFDRLWRLVRIPLEGAEPVEIDEFNRLRPGLLVSAGPAPTPKPAQRSDPEPGKIDDPAELAGAVLDELPGPPGGVRLDTAPHATPPSSAGRFTGLLQEWDAELASRRVLGAAWDRSTGRARAFTAGLTLAAAISVGDDGTFRRAAERIREEKLSLWSLEKVEIQWLLCEIVEWDLGESPLWSKVPSFFTAPEGSDGEDADAPTLLSSFLAWPDRRAGRRSREPQLLFQWAAGPESGVCR